jgi:hypothetical protein
VSARGGSGGPGRQDHQQRDASAEQHDRGRRRAVRPAPPGSGGVPVGQSEVESH